MTFKQDYFRNKFTHWKNDNRNLMAEREFDTVTYLLRVFCGFELKKGCSILDLGSGTGLLTDRILSRFPKSQIIIIDFLNALIALE